MKALTLHQPWAWAIIHAGKDVENRSWPIPWTVRGGRQIAVHAGKSYDWDGDEFIHRLGLTIPAKLPTGAIVGTVTITGAHKTCWQFDGGYCSPRWAMPDQWHWQLSDPRPVTPVPCRGAQGLWTVPDDVAAQIAGRAAMPPAHGTEINT